MTTQAQQTQLATALARHRRTTPDAEWLSYYREIGFPVSDKTDEQKILAAVQFDAAESGLLPEWFYKTEREDLDNE